MTEVKFIAATQAKAIAAAVAQLGDAMRLISVANDPNGAVIVTAQAHAPAPQIAPLAAPLDAEFAPQTAGDGLAKTALAADPVGGGASLHARLLAALAFHAPPFALASEIAGVAATLVNEEPVVALAAAFDARLRFDAEWLHDPARAQVPLTLVGAPGVGKTATALGLAHRHAADPRPLVLIAVGPAQAARASGLLALADAVGARFAIAETPGQVARAIREHAGARLVLDTPGVNPFDADDMERLGGFASAAGGAVLAVLDIGAQPGDVADAAGAFSLIGARHAVLSKCDTARRLGGAVSACDAGLSLALMNAGPGGHALSPATPLRLARAFLAAQMEAEADASAESEASA